MNSIRKAILWTVGVCVFCALGASMLIVAAPDVASAQAPDVDKRGLDQRPVDPPSPAQTAEPAVNGITVAYPFNTPDPQNDARRLQARYFDRANITIAVSSPGASRHPHLMVRAPADVQAEIRAVVGFLTGQQSEPTDAGGGAGDMSMSPPRPATQYGYVGLAQQQQQAAQDRIRVARQKLTDAKTDNDKQAARAELRQLLAEVFAQDMQFREKQAVEIEARLAKLRQQYAEREKVKDEIIDLQLKVIEQDAAGLGFPTGQSSGATPPTPIRSGHPFGNRSSLPASDITTDPMIRSGVPSRNLPAIRVDQHDPTPQERTLDEVRKTVPTVVATLKERGHFVESPDGKLYAYANINHPNGPSMIRIIDSATGKLVAAGTANSVVGALKFTKEGVASSEADGVLQLRVPLTRRTGPNGAVIEIPSSTAQHPFDPKTAALDPEFLAKYPTEHQTRVGELVSRGHFVGSQDGKLYAYVETRSDGIPEGTAEIRVCDARTGQRLAAAKIKAPVGKLKFFNEGVATEDADGTLKLRITFSKDHDTQDVLETKISDKSGSGPPNGPTISSPSTPTPTSNAPGAESGKDSPSDDPVTLAETVRREALAMLQGTWNCVAAGANETQLSKEALVALALQFAVKGDDVTISYVGDDLERHEAAGKVLIDTSTSPPQFHIDVHVLDIQAQSRLSGMTRIDRGALRMSRPGGTILIHRKFESEPSVFEFKRPRSDSAQPTDESKSAANPAARVPKERTAEMVAVRDLLAFKPETAGIDYDQPTEDAIDSCRVVLEPGAAWSLLSRDGVLLRRFEDTNRDGVVDSWRYYKAGKLVYRDVDSNHDGRIDRHDGPESPRISAR